MKGQKFSILHVVQTDTGVHPASYPVGTGDYLPRGRAASAWGWGPENVALYIHSPYAFMA
jgi:hypothetical protein